MQVLVVPFAFSFDDIGLTYSVPKDLWDSIAVGQIVEIPIKNKTELALVVEINSPHLNQYSPHPNPLPKGEGKKYPPKYIIELAKDLRQKSTTPEKIFWEILRDRKLLGIKFRRQHPFGRYIADFYSDEIKLVIELDGKIHNNTKEYDEIRDEIINTYGVRVLRIKNDEILENLELTINKIVNNIISSSIQPSPLIPLPRVEGNKSQSFNDSIPPLPLGEGARGGGLNQEIISGGELNLIQEKLNSKTYKLKDIIKIKNENIFLSSFQIKLLQFISSYYFTLIHNSLNLFLPKNLKEKVKKDKLNFYDSGDYSYVFDFPINLTTAQETTYNQIKNSKNNKILLYGVTASGKTEIYIKLIKDYLDKEKQVLFLIPEIILGNQLLKRIQKVFGKDVILINSTLSDAKKTTCFLDIYHNKAKIILGTRSSLFYPYNNLGLIIMDEEHDNSYVSDNSPRYTVSEILDFMGDNTDIKILKASGTPSINSMYKALNGEYELLHLLTKYKK